MFLKNLMSMSANETVGGKLLGGVIGGVGKVVATTVATYVISEMLKPEEEQPAQNFSGFMTREERAAYMAGKSEGGNYKEV